MSPRQAYRLLNRAITVRDAVSGKTFVTTLVRASATFGTVETADGKTYRLAALERITPHVERHNAEFIRLMDGAGLTRQQVATMLGVSIDTIISWRKPAGGKSSFACSAERVEELRAAIKKMRKSA